MKKYAKFIFSILLFAIMLASVSVTSFAENTYEITVGETESIGFYSDTPYVSSDTSVIVIRQDSDYQYSVEAVGEGTATVSGGKWGSTSHQPRVYIVTEAKDEQDFDSEYKDRLEQNQSNMEDIFFGAFGGIYIFIVIIWLVVILGVVIGIIYIFIEAPKCGMSRFWALVPLFSSLLGLIVFIIVRSRNKTLSPKNKITCPTCGSVHPADTSVCSVCDTKLK